MKICLNQINRVAELQSLAIIFLKQMDSAIKPIDRFIFLRLVVSYGGRKLPKTQLKHIAKNVQVHPTRLNESLKNLKEFGLIKIENKKIWINLALCFEHLSYKRIERSKKDKTACELVRHRYKNSRLLFKLFEMILDVRISHMQKNAKNLMAMNFQQWLVLVNLVMFSDSRGVVKNVGTHLLAIRTGMSRDALLRAINKLFDLKIILSKVHGTLNNNILASNTPVYLLNLSAEIWQEHSCYGTYYFYKTPDDLNLIAKIVFESFKEYEEKLESLKLKSLKMSERKDVFYSIDDENSNYILHEMNLGLRISKNFVRYIQLMSSDFKEGKQSINTFSRNLERIDFLLKDYFAMKICNLKSAIDYDMDFMERKWKLVDLDSIIKVDDLYENDLTNNEIGRNDQKSTLKQLISGILFIIARVIYRNELLPILLNQFNEKNQFSVTYVPSEPHDASYSIYFIRNFSHKLSENQYKLISYTRLPGSNSEYHFQCSDLDRNDLKELGISIC